MKNTAIYKALTIPIILYLGLLLVYPFLHAVFISLAPLSNYKKILSDGLFILSIRNNIIIAFISISLEIVLGIALAVMVNSLRRFSFLFTTLVLIPFIIPEIVFLTSAKFILSEHGYLNGLLNIFGIDPVYWLKPGSFLSILLISFIDTWRLAPFVFLIILAALKNIPTEIIEAAKVEGANNRQILFSIILPLLTPAIVASVLLRSVDALRIFTTPIVLTGVEGVPVISSYAYYQWAYNNNPKLACASSVILASIVLITSLGYTRLWRQSQEIQL